MDLKHLVGMRILKTGIAVMISAALGMTPLIVSPFFTIVSTVLAMQNTVKNSLDTGKTRILGTILGASLGFIFATIYVYLPVPSYAQPLLLGLAIMISISLGNRFNLGAGLGITMTVLVSIIVGEEAGDLDLMAATIYRTTDTIIGIVVSFGVNYFIKPPNYFGDLLEEIGQIEAITLGALRSVLIQQPFKLDDLQKEIARLDKTYTQISADRKFHKNPVPASQVKAAVDACHEIYFHVKSIAKLEKENPSMTLIDERDAIEIYRVFYMEQDIDLEDVDSIFEYHLYQVLSQIKVLHGVTANREKTTS